MKERLAELLSRKMSGEVSAEELQELDQWLQSNPGDQYFADILLAFWNNRHDTNYSSDATTSADQHFAHILEMAGDSNNVESEEPIPEARRISWIKKLLVAASIAAAIVLSIKLYQHNRSIPETKKDEPANQVIARKGARSKMVLPDGTQVWLNSDSKLQYAASFNKEFREVTLEGEAYFDVVKDAEHPFIVHTSAIDIRVLGTAFNVKSYEQENTIETTLIHGLVEVINKNKPQSPKIILRPKEKLVFNKIELAAVSKSPDEMTISSPEKTAIAITALPKNRADTSLVETSWVYNRLLFEGDTFRELAVKMERWFNVRIDFKNERVANYRLRGVFEDETIEQALQALQLVTSFNYKIKNNTIEITK